MILVKVRLNMRYGAAPTLKEGSSQEMDQSSLTLEVFVVLPHDFLSIRLCS